MSATFPETRWRRAGATPAEILELGSEFTAMGEDAQVEYEASVVGRPDDELAEELEQRRAKNGPDPLAPLTTEPERPSEAAAHDDPDAADSDADGEDEEEPDELDEALHTFDTTQAYLEEYPEAREQLLEREQAGKARKTVLELLAPPSQ